MLLDPLKVFDNSSRLKATLFLPPRCALTPHMTNLHEMGKDLGMDNTPKPPTFYFHKNVKKRHF